jgi:acyl-CoA hydrolase
MATTFQHQTVVRRDHLNPYGSLSGGAVLGMVDELAFIACTRAYPGRNFVARAVLDVEFTAPARLGDVLEFSYGVEHAGRTSVHVRVEMLVHDGTGGRPAGAFDGTVVMVCVDRDGRPAPLRG